MVSFCFPQCSEAQKLLNIAKELLHTEEAYVKRLNLLDQVTLHLSLSQGFCVSVAVCLFASGTNFNLVSVPVVLVIEISAELDWCCDPLDRNASVAWITQSDVSVIM